MTKFNIASAIAQRIGMWPTLGHREARILLHYQSEIDRGCFKLRKARNPQPILDTIIERCIGDLRGQSHQPNQGSYQR